MFGHRQGEEPDTVSAESLGIGGLFAHLRDAVVVADDAGRIVLWNPAASTMFGYAAEEAIGQNVEMLVPTELRGQHRAGLSHWRDTGAGRYIDSDRPLELPALGRDGTKLRVELTLSPLKDGDTRYVLAMLRDATARKALEAELVHRSLRDEVTDLPNRTLFLDTVRRGLVHARWRKHGLAVLVVDLARFSELRASLGEEAADNLLAQVGQRLAQAMRTEDIVAHLEADVFGVVLLSLESELAAGEVADRLLALLQTPFRVGRQRIVLSACIGVAVSDTPRQPAEELLRDAELALLEAKRHGTTAWHRYDRSIAVPVPPESLDLLSDLRLALERDELVVHYQPILRLADASLFGFEALVRWQHPERGLLQAAEFIATAEQHGLIGQIDAWVLREASRQGAAWQATAPVEPPLTIAVNVSASEFHQSGMADNVQKSLREHPLAPGSLLLEITETTALLDPQRTAAVLDRIRGMGVRLALDDFGVGSHALSHLRHLPLDALKLDRGFVGELQDARTVAIVRAVITLAHELDMDVVAEGVETADQAHALRELGCDLAQGHLFSAALPADEAEALLEGAQQLTAVGAPVAE
jgi:PAS domain S-box-containing protein/diguanylate cyclase (GGDEF)-like protein